MNRSRTASLMAPAVAVVAIVLIATRWQASIAARHEGHRLEQKSDRNSRTLVLACERTDRRNAYLRVKFSPDALTADRYMPLLNCRRTVAAGGREVALDDIAEARLVHRTRLELERNARLAQP